MSASSAPLEQPSALRSLFCWAMIVLSAVIAVLFSLVLANEQTTIQWAIAGAVSVALTALVFRPDRPWRWWWIGLLLFIPMVPTWLFGMGALLEREPSVHPAYWLLVVLMYVWAALAVVGGIALAALRVQRRRAAGVAGIDR